MQAGTAERVEGEQQQRFQIQTDDQQIQKQTKAK